jgi:hypothetical protein
MLVRFEEFFCDEVWIVALNQIEAPKSWYGITKRSRIEDASAYLTEDLGPAMGVFTNRSPFLRPPRLFDIATEQTRALRSRMIIEAIVNQKLDAAIIRLGRSVAYIDHQAKRTRNGAGGDAFLHTDAVTKAAYLSDKCF